MVLRKGYGCSGVGRVAMPAIAPVYAETFNGAFNYDALSVRPLAGVLVSRKSANRFKSG